MPTTRYVWDLLEDAIHLECQGSGSVIARYTSDLQGNLISEFRDGQPAYLAFDAIGNVTEATNGAASIVATQQFSAFGDIVDSTGSSVSPFRFGGRMGYYYDAETGDYYIRARTYARHLGRWTSLGTLNILDGYATETPAVLNEYTYARNNPLRYAYAAIAQVAQRQMGNCECRLRICVNSLSPPLQAAGHLFIVLEHVCDGQIRETTGYRGGPGTPLEGCACKQQLIGVWGAFDASFIDHPDNEKSTGPPRCFTYTIQPVPPQDARNACEKAHQCLTGILDKINKCCINYVGPANELGIGGCNSNCLVGWLVKSCFGPAFGLFGIGVTPFPSGITPGLFAPVPKCVKDGEDRRQLAEEACVICGDGS